MNNKQSKLPQAKRGRRKPWLIVLSATLALTVGIIGYVIYEGIGVYKSLGDLQKPKDESVFKSVPAVPEEIKPPEWTGKERVNVLLLGADARGMRPNQIPRSDSMLVASIDPVTHKANLFSILRDTYVEIPGYKSNRINAAISLGGPDLAMKTVSNLLGLDVQYYVYVDFEGFKSLVDSIDGIDIDVEKDMHYTDNADENRYDIDLKKGFQHLNGTKALEYVRFRHDATSDFTRTERQRKFLTAVAEQLKSGWNLLRIKQITQSVTPYIETNIGPDDLLKLAYLGKSSDIGESVQLPSMKLLEETTRGGAQVIAVKDEDKLKEFVQDVVNGRDEPSQASQSTENQLN